MKKIVDSLMEQFGLGQTAAEKLAEEIAKERIKSKVRDLLSNMAFDLNTTPDWVREAAFEVLTPKTKAA
jgi:hypothetical protein